MSSLSVSLNPPPSFRKERESSSSNPFTRINWKQVCSTLIQTKEFLSSYLFAAERCPSDSNSIPFHQLLCTSDDTFALSDDTDLEVIPDDAKSQALNQIRRSDASHFLKLYTAVAEGESRMKIVGSLDFKKKILENIKILLTRPLGRQLIGSICSLKRNIVIQEGERNKMTSLPDGNLVVSINFDPNAIGFPKCQDSKGKVSFEPFPAYIMFAHELIHVLHRDAFMADQNWITVRDNLHEASPDPQFTNLSEQLTIGGLDGEPTLLCENALRAEFGMPARVSHIKSEFPSYTPEDRPDIDTPNEKGVTRLENAVTLKAYEETCKLLDAGANPGNAYCASVLHDDPEMIQLLLEQGADPHQADHYGNLPLHVAVFMDRIDIAKLLIEGGARVVQHDASGQTALQVALKNQNLNCALLLITNGAPLTQKALECLDPIYRARFLAYVPPLMNWTDNTESTEPKDGASKNLPSKKRLRPIVASESELGVASESEVGADLREKKRSRHR